MPIKSFLSILLIVIFSLASKMDGWAQFETLPLFPALPKTYAPKDSLPKTGKIRFELFQKDDIFITKPFQASIQPNAAMHDWGWFCRSEFAFQKMTRLPLFLRLGSKQQVDRLEGKNSIIRR